MANIRKYLQQTVIIERREYDVDGNPVFDFYGDPSFTGPEEIPARVEERQDVVRGQGGNEILSSTRVLTEGELNAGDTVDGRRVEARENIVDRRGRVVGWRSFL